MSLPCYTLLLGEVCRIEIWTWAHAKLTAPRRALEFVVVVVFIVVNLGCVSVVCVQRST